MLVAVEFDNKFRAMTREIDNAATNRHLTAEVKTAALELAQTSPEGSLRICQLGAQ